MLFLISCLLTVSIIIECVFVVQTVKNGVKYFKNLDIHVVSLFGYFSYFCLVFFMPTYYIYLYFAFIFMV